VAQLLKKIPSKSGALLEALLYREVPRGDVAAIVGTGDPQAPARCLRF
jgi:hypothetical protein